MLVVPDDILWNEILKEAVHLIKVNQAAELSAQSRMPFLCFLLAALVVGKAALDASRHSSLLATGVAEALLYAVAHDYIAMGASIAASAASAAVNLIGRNEGGLTLSRAAAESVLRDFETFFVPNTRRGNYPSKRPLCPAKAIVNMVISDANKAFVVEYSGAIDALVAGLLLDESNPRRTQEAGDELQATCALVLQNLALSDVGKAALRSHVGVMDGLRRLSSPEAATCLSSEARQYASGSLFELDESTRRQQRSAASEGDGTGSTGVAEHVMLSYNWDHKVPIQRLNLALKARGYSVWIDTEKMQGSTVEAMSEAVEDAAVMCYGISQAYKESTNCRLEAQYAFQQELDMVRRPTSAPSSPHRYSPHHIDLDMICTISRCR